MFTKWCEITSCNGVVDLYEARTSKGHFAFWAVVMVSMAVASVYFTFRTIQGYIDTPTVTNVALTREPQLDLPEVLICFNGGFNVKALKQSGFNETLVHAFNTKMFYYEAQIDINATKSKMLEYMIKNQVNVKEFLKRHAFTCEDLSVYDDRLAAVWMPNPCTNFTGVVTFAGNCYIYTHNMKQFYPGPSGGLKLKLRVPPESYSSMYPAESEPLELSDSFTLYLEKKFGDTMPERSFVIPSKSVVSMTLNTKRYVRTSDCDSRPGVTNSNSCFNECWLEEGQRRCNCNFAMFSRFTFNSSVEICNFLDGCGVENYTLVKECQKACLPICDEWVFEASVTNAQLQATNTTMDKITTVNIAYNSMQYTRVDNVAAFTIDMAIANVGGQAGLWLGVSIVTIIQALYYLVLGIVRCCSERTLKKINISNKIYGDRRKM